MLHDLLLKSHAIFRDHSPEVASGASLTRFQLGDRRTSKNLPMAIRQAPLLDEFATYLVRVLDGIDVDGVPARVTRIEREAAVDINIEPRPIEHRSLIRRLLKSDVARAQFRGLVPTSDGGEISFAIRDPWPIDSVGDTPASFTVLAVVTTFNEAEIIEQLIMRLLALGVVVHVVDNWSTDATNEIVSSIAERNPQVTH